MIGRVYEGPPELSRAPFIVREARDETARYSGSTRSMAFQSQPSALAAMEVSVDDGAGADVILDASFDEHRVAKNEKAATSLSAISWPSGFERDAVLYGRDFRLEDGRRQQERDRPEEPLTSQRSTK